MSLQKYEAVPEDEAAALRKQLEPFLKRNPYSKIQKRGKSYHVINPWDDDSLSFVLENNVKRNLIAALNNLILPPRFTALYHLDSNTMEYIYTLLHTDSPYTSRQFEFTLDGKTYHCQFKGASERLLLLSKEFRPIKESPTEYRNLLFLSMYVNPKPSQRSILPEDLFKELFEGKSPVSFFVTGFENFEEDTIVKISKHLNFLMSYYDREFPFILIHSAKSDRPKPMKQLQFIEMNFPRKISCTCKEPIMLDLVLAANDVSEPRLKFLYYYQVLEYAAFYYVDSDVKRKISQIIDTPDIHARLDKYLPKIVDVVTDIRQSDEAKLNKTVEIRCTPDVIWKELQQNLPYFSKKQEFEGGFFIEPFISQDMTLESFATMWIPKTPDTLRKIRNALVHGRESRLGAVIAPTRDNELKIRPWIPVIRRMAEQVIIFSSLT